MESQLNRIKVLLSNDHFNDSLLSNAHFHHFPETRVKSAQEFHEKFFQEEKLELLSSCNFAIPPNPFLANVIILYP